MDQVRLDGKTAIVTGANTGIGKETAKELAKRGCRVILACRSEERARQAIDDLTNEENIKPDDLVFMKLDLGSLQSVREFAERFNANEPRLNLLVNNAAVFLAGQDKRSTTVDGFESHFGVNHLGHFLLTNLLLDKLKESAPARIINVSGDVHRLGSCKLNFEDLQFEKGWGPVKAYGKSKTANVLFTVALAQKLEGTQVYAYSLHPGAIETDLLRHQGKCMTCFKNFCMRCCCCCFVSSIPGGTKTTIYCCLEPSIGDQAHSGQYYRKSRMVTAASFARNPDLATQLWNISEELVALK